MVFLSTQVDMEAHLCSGNEIIHCWTVWEFLLEFLLEMQAPFSFPGESPVGPTGYGS